ncbi:MAG: penicillin acylase family protein [Kiloniellaceae bacterium]
MSLSLGTARRTAGRNSIWWGLGTIMLSWLVTACALLTPLPGKSSLEERLAAMPTGGLPLRGRVIIHWDEHQIPFIEAEHDADAAFALGLVHAHLRLGQMEIFRRISQGRIAEMGGPLAADIDHGLRILNFGRAAAKIAASLPPETRAWLDGYVRGINHYQRHVAKLPLEYAVLGLEREAWTVGDVLTTGRLAGTDVNWLVWANLLKLRRRDDWPEIWARLVESGSASVPSFEGTRDSGLLDDLFAGLSRSGSNSLAVAPRRSKSGGAIMANDPHLGIQLPNIWLLAGIKSPSYHVVGVMFAGLPIFAIGRNPWISWGGTNMRAASSELYDVSRLPPGEITERRETIGVRWWFDRDITVRETKWGPVLSDAPLLKGMGAPAFALKWTGHQASDEITAMLNVSRARNFKEFRDAFRSFAVPGENMLYADHDGNIGQVMAVRLPDRNGPPPGDIILDALTREAIWETMRTVEDLPFSLNPERGFLVSANNRPAETETPIGYFFSPDDRVERMARLLEATGKVGLKEIEQIQQDVYMPSSVTLRDVLVRRLDLSGIAAAATGRQREVIDLLESWDGHYRAGSRGALAFELFRNAFTSTFYEFTFGGQDWAAFAGISRIKSLMLEDLERAEPEKLDHALRRALQAAADRLDDFADWGDMHRLGLAHPLRLLPLIGGRYRFTDLPIGGSSDTLMKTAHGPTDRRHFTRYGSNARHVSDLSDMDSNYFVLLGGQDGWFNSTTFLDQLPLWLEGKYIWLPLRMDTVRARFAHKTELAPDHGERPG